MGGHCIGFVVAAEAGGEIGRVYGIRRNRGDAYALAATVTEATPPIADPLAEMFAVFAASRLAGG